jgi:hypothetical protein
LPAGSGRVVRVGECKVGKRDAGGIGHDYRVM